MIIGRHIADYIENLCRQHKDVLHSDYEIHFVNLNDDKQQTSQAETLRYPAVLFETAGYTTIPYGESFRKRHQCHLQVVTHITDTGDYAAIESALAKCDNILTDFLSRMLHDKRHRSPRWLSGLDLSGMEVIPIENKSDALYGVLAELYLPEQICSLDFMESFNQQ